MDQAQASALLKQMLGPDADFRDGQWEAIDQIANHRRRLLVVQRTGWGKSIVYFLATKILRAAGAGPTLLISPLLSLMRNQLLATEKLGVRAATIHSENVKESDRRICHRGETATGRSVAGGRRGGFGMDADSAGGNVAAAGQRAGASVCTGESLAAGRVRFGVPPSGGPDFSPNDVM